MASVSTTFAELSARCFTVFGKLNRRDSARREKEYDGELRPMNFSFAEIVFLMLLALILFGPRRLPEIARTWGKFMAEFKRASGNFQTQIHEEIRKLELEEAVDPNKHVSSVTSELEKAVNQADVSLNSALNRLTERIKGSVPQDYDA